MVLGDWASLTLRAVIDYTGGSVSIARPPLSRRKLLEINMHDILAKEVNCGCAFGLMSRQFEQPATSRAQQRTCSELKPNR